MLYHHHSADLWQLNHKVTFDGINKLIIVNNGVTALDIRADVYSAWVEWIALPVRMYSKFLFAMRFTGIDIIPGGFTGDTYFLINGWKLVVDLTKVAISGVLFSDNYGTAYYDANMNPVYPATVSSLVMSSVSYQNVVTGDLSSIVVPTAAANAAAVWANAIDGMTSEQIMKVMLAALAGKRAGIGTATETYYAQDDVTPVITLTPDAQGNGLPVVTP